MKQVQLIAPYFTDEELNILPKAAEFIISRTYFSLEQSVPEFELIS
jgi:hypothetical protein